MKCNCGVSIYKNGVQSVTYCQKKKKNSFKKNDLILIR
jgi:hypothetical protein